MKSTKKELPEAIEFLIPEKERTLLINQIISEARDGEFHDYENDKYPAPKMALVDMLRATKDSRLDVIIEDVKSGDYDE